MTLHDKELDKGSGTAEEIFATDEIDLDHPLADRFGLLPGEFVTDVKQIMNHDSQRRSPNA